MGFTDDRKQLWAGGLDNNKIYVFDVGTDPAQPKLVKTIKDLGKHTGFLGPHTFYALPGQVMMAAPHRSWESPGVISPSSAWEKGPCPTS